MTETTATLLAVDPGYRLGYVVSDEMYYVEAWRTGAGDDPTLIVSKAADVGGCVWEFHIKDRSAALGYPAVQVRIFDDAFASFAEIGPFFAALAAEQPSSLGQVRDILDRFGFADGTERQHP